MQNELITTNQTITGLAVGGTNVAMGSPAINIDMLSNTAILGMTFGAWVMLFGLLLTVSILTLNIMKIYKGLTTAHKSIKELTQ